MTKKTIASDLEVGDILIGKKGGEHLIISKEVIDQKVSKVRWLTFKTKHIGKDEVKKFTIMENTVVLHRGLIKSKD